MQYENNRAASGITMFLRYSLLYGILLSSILVIHGTAFCQNHLYSGPLFDAMAQLDHKVDFDRAMSDVRKAGVNKIALFARSLEKLGQNENGLIALRDRNPDLIVLGAPKYFPLDMDLDAAYIAATVRGVREQGYAFVGEICYSHSDKTVGKQTAKGERYVDPSAPGTKALLEELASLHVPLMTHWEVYAWERDWPLFDRLYSAHPKQSFIIPHMAFGSPDQVRTVFEEHPNVYMTLSKKEKEMKHISSSKKQSSLGSGMLNEDGSLDAVWRELLIEHQDRILFATDAHISRRWERYGQYIETYRSLLGQLPETAAKKIAYQNAEILYGATCNAPNRQN